ncbi:MAG: threonine aldolase family protein [Bacillota bacterium]
MSDEELQARCTRRLSGHKPVPPAEALEELARHPSAAQPLDLYGAGGAAAQLEKRTAELLGKPAAMFFIKGMIAQMTVLRVAADRGRTPNILVHPMSHIELDEEGALWRLHNLQPIRLGKYAPFTLAQLQAVSDPIGAIVVELPLRRSGYRLPPLDELRAISAWSRQRGVHLHFDGARLWEAAAGYGIPLDELAALADSVYVSFYKGLGGLGGAAVAGDADFVTSLAVWKTRHGGNLYRVFPYAISALAGLDRHLPRMPEYVARARGLAARLQGDDRIALTPSVPETNAFHLLVPGTVGALTERNRAFADERGVWLFNMFYESPVEGRSVAEVAIGDSSDDHDAEEAAGWIRDFLDFA